MSWVSIAKEGARKERTISNPVPDCPFNIDQQYYVPILKRHMIFVGIDPQSGKYEWVGFGQERLDQYTVRTTTYYTSPEDH